MPLHSHEAASSTVQHLYSPVLQKGLAIHTSDWDLIRHLLTTVITPHEVSPLMREAKGDIHFRHAPLESTSFNYIQYGTDVAIDARCLDHCFTVELLVEGLMEVQFGRLNVTGTTDTAIIYSPESSFRIRKNKFCHSVFVVIKREALERFFSDYLGISVRKTIEFKPEMNVREGLGRSWRELIQFLCSEFDRSDSVPSSGIVSKEIESMLMHTLLSAQPHNYSDLIFGKRSPAAPYYLKRAEEFINENAQMPIDLSTLVKITGISGASLSAAFQKYRATSPMAFVREVRLSRCREELAHGTPEDTSVTTVATKWGFSNLGRFAAYYYRRFGEYPSNTLRKSRA